MQSSVAIENLSAGNCGDAVAGDEDADEIERVGGGDGDGDGAVAGSGGSEGIDGFRKRELFAAEAGDEATATKYAASFETAENAEEVAPAGSVGLAGEEIAEEDTVTGEQNVGGGLKGGVGAVGLLDGCGGGEGLFGEE